MVVIPIDSTKLQVYDMDEMDFIVVDDSFAQRSDIEKTKDYVGAGLLSSFIVSSLGFFLTEQYAHVSLWKINVWYWCLISVQPE